MLQFCYLRLYFGTESVLSSVAPDGKDGYRFKLDKVRPILSSFNDVTAKIIKKLNMVSAP